MFIIVEKAYFAVSFPVVFGTREIGVPAGLPPAFHKLVFIRKVLTAVRPVSAGHKSEICAKRFLTGLFCFEDGFYERNLFWGAYQR